jgi:DNA-binding transcriptional LysR family regulator
MRLNSRQIEAFRAVMLTGAMTAAAETLRITQPAVSRLIQDLEHTLKFALFHRRGNQLSPTAEAVDFLTEVQSSFLGLEHLAAYAENLRSTRSGSLRIGALPALALGFLPNFIAKFCSSRPDVHVRIDGVPSHQLLEMIAGGQYDIGICATLSERPALKVTSIAAPVVVVVPDGHRLADFREIRATDLAGERVIMLGRDGYLRHTVETALSSVNTIQTIETSLSAIACALVLSGAGVTLVDLFCAHQFAGRGVTIRPFVPSIDAGFRMVHSSHRPPSRLAAQFKNEFQAHIESFLANQANTIEEVRRYPSSGKSRKVSQ